MQYHKFFPKPILHNQGLTPAMQYQSMQQQAGQQICRGLQVQSASTGIPMDSLQGGAYITALLAAIGGGSIAAGGNGIDGGLKTLCEYIWAKGAEHGLQQGLDYQRLESEEQRFSRCSKK